MLIFLLNQNEGLGLSRPVSCSFHDVACSFTRQEMGKHPCFDSFFQGDASSVYCLSGRMADMSRVFF